MIICSTIVTVIEKGVYESSLYPSPELRYRELLSIALDPPRWGENEHIQALSIALGMPIYVFNDFLGARNSDVVLLDRSLDCSQLQEQFRHKVDGTWIHMVYCSKELYDVSASKMVQEFDLPPLCIQLYHNHFTALMYKSESSLQVMPVLILLLFFRSLFYKKLTKYMAIAIRFQQLCWGYSHRYTVQ